jgi:glycosyltransferase involved in cell wall biosynthesis
MWVPRIASLGHEVIISAYWGLNGSSTNWTADGSTSYLVLPPGQDLYGNDILAEHCKRMRIEAVITLMDAWVLNRDMVRGLAKDGIPLLAWMPVDVGPLPWAGAHGLGAMDLDFLAGSPAFPVAMSRHGASRLEAAGIPRYGFVPHGVDTSVFRPVADRAATRRSLGLNVDLAGRFVIGIAAANLENTRKNMDSQFAAFSLFRRQHPEADAFLLVHSLPVGTGPALNLYELAAACGISEHISFSDPYQMQTSLVRPPDLSRWFGCLDVLSAAGSGEGFCIPIIEAQAAGTPVVVGDNSAMSELCGAGWRVKGEWLWNQAHRSWWNKPTVEGIARAYGKAWEARQAGAPMARLREKARKFALRYDADRVLTQYWKPVLADLESMTLAGQRRLDPVRDEVTARLAGAWNSGKLGDADLGERMARVLAARREADFGDLVADLPAEPEAA